MNGLAKTIVIPPECVENFVDFSDLPDGGHWFDQGVHMAALTHHEVGYSIDYPHSKRHNILYCRSGSYVCEHDGQSVLVRPGEMLVLPWKIRQIFRAGEASDGLFFLLTPEAWGEGLAFSHKHARNLDAIGILMETAIRERYSPGGECLIRREIAALIVALVRQDLAMPEKRETPIDRLCARLRLRPDLPWTVESMAEFCGISPSHLFAICGKQTGVSPYELLSRIRVEFAETLLRQTDYPIKVIASQCGYALPFSFTRAFTKHTGASPAEYRRTDAGHPLSDRR